MKDNMYLHVKQYQANKTNIEASHAALIVKINTNTELKQIFKIIKAGL